eukprot:6597657-Prymnesium_polylepis.1
MIATSLPLAPDAIEAAMAQSNLWAEWTAASGGQPSFIDDEAAVPAILTFCKRLHDALRLSG